MAQPKEQLWTIEDVAEFCRVKPSVIKHWVYTRSIPFIKIGKQILFDKEDLEEWIERQKRGAVSLDSTRRLKGVV